MQEEAITFLRSGQKEAFRQLFDEYFNALCAFANKYVWDPLDVEDLVQEAFISYWEKRGNFGHLSAVKAFLYTSVRNKCLNFLKHKTVVQKHESALIYELESGQFFQDHVLEEETFNQLYQEIEHLPESSQKIMLLALKGLKNREIAAQLDISENTVKTQKKIAYARIKQNLNPVIQAVFLSL